MNNLVEKNCNKSHCKTCVFHPNESQRIDLSEERIAEIRKYLETFKSSHICHQTNLTCYGGLEVQAKAMFEKNIIHEPTVDCLLMMARIYLKPKK